MPVEIKELVIRVVTTRETAEMPKAPTLRPTAEEKEAIIQECIRQILRILKKKEER
jgi:hypothetical protein